MAAAIFGPKSSISSKISMKLAGAHAPTKLCTSGSSSRKRRLKISALASRSSTSRASVTDVSRPIFKLRRTDPAFPIRTSASVRQSGGSRGNHSGSPLAAPSRARPGDLQHGGLLLSAELDSLASLLLVELGRWPRAYLGCPGRRSKRRPNPTRSRQQTRACLMDLCGWVAEPDLDRGDVNGASVDVVRCPNFPDSPSIRMGVWKGEVFCPGRRRASRRNSGMKP